MMMMNEQYIICRYNENYKIFKSAPTCFGSQSIHHQGALYSAWLKITRMSLSCPLIWTVPSYTVNYTHAQPVRICCHNTDLDHVNGHDGIIRVIFSQAL
jgi:hypothetical protein